MNHSSWPHNTRQFPGCRQAASMGLTPARQSPSVSLFSYRQACRGGATTYSAPVVTQLPAMQG